MKPNRLLIVRKIWRIEEKKKKKKKPPQVPIRLVANLIKISQSVRQKILIN